MMRLLMLQGLLEHLAPSHLVGVSGLLMLFSIIDVIESSSVHYTVEMRYDRLSWLVPICMSLTAQDLIGQTVASFMCQPVITV